MSLRFRLAGFVLAAALLLMPAAVRAQEQPASVYYKKFVRHPDGSLVEQVPPQATFTAYLNGDASRVLIENAPRWDGSGENINGKGTVGVELGNFPTLSAGDSVFVRFTDTVASEQGTIGDRIDTIPWTDNDPFTALQLAPVALPARPAQVRLQVTEAGARTLTWAAVPGATYAVYRRTLEDLLPGGPSRRLYTRVAEGLTEGRFVDPSRETDSTYAYIVYAHADGVTSAHSAEVVEALQITGLAGAATATNATLTWDAFDVPVGRTVGYAVYRRTADGDFGAPIAYTGPETQYTDTRLTPGTTYAYQVRARNEARVEFGTSEAVAVTTEASTAGTYTYASLKVAVVLYRHADDRRDGRPYRISDAAVEDIRQMLEQARLFYWRNSKMKLNLAFTYLPIEAYMTFDGAGSAESTRMTGDHLEELFGVMSTQYDLIYRITPATGGNWSWGVTGLPGLPGPERGGDGRHVAFSQHPVPQGGAFDNYPADFPGLQEEGSNHIWLFTHEAQHAIDGIYRFNGHPEMGHGDFPELYGNPNVQIGADPGYPGDYSAYPPGYPEGWGRRFGMRFDFQGTMLRDFDAYEELLPEWGDIYETVDADGDGFPDADPRVPLDEARFGSSPQAADTDGDGYTDRQEALDGLYHYSYSNPRDPDTDGDGLLDGEDAHPRYAVQTRLKQVTAATKPAIDGDVGDWPAAALLADSVYVAGQGQAYAPALYMSYDADSLYLALDLPGIGIPTLHFDFDADGRWYGAGNTEITFDVSDERFQTFRSWDARADVEACLESGACTGDGTGKKSGDGMWDADNLYQQQFSRRVFYPSTVGLGMAVDFPRIQIEMAIPRNEAAGLTLRPGTEFGLRVDYDKVNNVPGARATTFDQWSYVYFTLADETLTSTAAEAEAPATFSLAPNYPNPFNPQTRIAYTVPAGAEVRLAVYDLLGRPVRTLVDAYRAPGTYAVTWDGTNDAGAAVASGTYFYRLETPDGPRLVRRMLLVK